MLPVRLVVIAAFLGAHGLRVTQALGRGSGRKSWSKTMYVKIHVEDLPSV